MVMLSHEQASRKGDHKMFNKTKNQYLHITWVLIVLGTLWGSSALMLIGMGGDIPRKLTYAMVAGTFGLGFLWLVQNITPAPVVE
jgi:tellurite resistance protein TehA-like permease